MLVQLFTAALSSTCPRGLKTAAPVSDGRRWSWSLADTVRSAKSEDRARQVKLLMQIYCSRSAECGRRWPSAACGRRFDDADCSAPAIAVHAE